MRSLSVLDSRRPHCLLALLGLTLLTATRASTAIAQSAHSLDASTIAAWAALLRTHDTRVADTLAVDAALSSRVTALRAAGARVVGLNRIAARYDVLRGLLRTERDSTVASDAAFALGLATDSVSCGALRDAMQRPGVGNAAAWALGELGARCGAFGDLLKTVRAPAVRASLLRVAIKWTAFPDSAVASAYRSATSTGERWAALYAFARARRNTGAPFALAASHDANGGIRDVAARLLATSLQPPADSARNVARLDSMLSDRSPHVRISAVRSLAGYRGSAAEPLMRAWPLEDDENVRVTMAQSISTVATDTSSLWSAWWADSTPMVRRSLIASAREVGAIGRLQALAPDSLVWDADSVSRARAAARDTAARSTPSPSPAPSVDAPVAPEFYERIVRTVIAPSLQGHPPELLIATSYGTVRIVLDGVRAPMTSDHLSRLARADYFRNLRFHRVVPAFVAQGGDPRGDGSGGPGYAIRDELNRSGYVRGAVGMALSGPDTGGSQFFVTLTPQPHLDGHYTVFGTVVAGFAAMDALTQGDAILNISTLPR